MAQERLNKVMANAGVASRRACDEMIQAGRVTVNGQVVTELGVKVDPARDQIRVDGEALKPRPTAERRTYLMLYKPAGVLSVFDDPRGRPGLESLLKGSARLYPVGRLDMDSEGLLLLTDDGDLTLKLSHPRFEHAKTYLVLVDRPPGSDTLARFRRGIQLDDGVTAPSQWRVLEHPAVVPPPADPAAAEGVWLHVTMHEGRKRQIRRMARAENLEVRRLVRIGLGSLRLDRKLKPGESRPLTRREIDQLLAEAAGQTPATPAPRKRRSDSGPRREEARRPPGQKAPPRRGAAAVAARGALAEGGRRPAGPKSAAPRREEMVEREPKRRGPRAGGVMPAPRAASTPSSAQGAGARAPGRADASGRGDQPARPAASGKARSTAAGAGPRRSAAGAARSTGRPASRPTGAHSNRPGSARPAGKKTGKR